MTIGMRTRGAPRKTKAAPSLQANVGAHAMTPAMELFVARFLVRFCASAAYRDSHPAAAQSTAETEGSRLLRDPRVASEIKRRLDETKERLRCDGDRVLWEVCAIAFSSISDAFNKDGTLIPLCDMPRDIAVGIKKYKRIEILGPAMDGTEQRSVVGYRVEIEMADKLAALKALGQHLKLFVEKVEHRGADELVAAITAGRERALKP